MDRDAIRRKQFTHPFEPFAIRLVGGEKVEVDRPEFLLHSRSGRKVTFSAPDGRYLAIPLDQIAGLDSSGRCPSG